MMDTLKPLRADVLIRWDAPEKYSGAILIPDMYQRVRKDNSVGEVLAIGPEVTADELFPGCKVLVEGHRSGWSDEISNRQYSLVNEELILGILEE